MERHKHKYPVNVKIPQFYIDIIDNALNSDGFLYNTGFMSRAHFVSETVKEKLVQLGLLSEENAEVVVRRRSHFFQKKDLRKKR